MINAMFNKQVWGKPEFIDGSLETLKSWDKYEIIIYSNRVKYMGAENLARWLIDYKIPFNGIDNGDNKYYAHIDDSPSKLASTHSKLKILFTQSWNTRCLDIQNQFTRVYSWEEIGKMI
jgi:5'(3')-deoxyribonucleotidase